MTLYSEWEGSNTEWAALIFDEIEATREACAEFDESEDGVTYKEITGMSMSTNLGFFNRRMK
jgi:hypothetical protein